MKTMLIFILIFNLLLGMAVASERIDRMIEEDAMESIQKIFLKKIELQTNRKLLNDVNDKLEKAKKGELISLKVRKIGATITILAIVIGTYKAHFPLGMRFLLSTYMSMTGAGVGLIKLGHGDIQKLARDLAMAQAKMEILEKDLNTQIEHLCEEDGRHKLCYRSR